MARVLQRQADRHSQVSERLSLCVVCRSKANKMRLILFLSFQPSSYLFTFSSCHVWKHATCATNHSTTIPPLLCQVNSKREKSKRAGQTTEYILHSWENHIIKEPTPIYMHQTSTLGTTQSTQHFHRHKVYTYLSLVTDQTKPNHVIPLLMQVRKQEKTQ